MSDPIRLLIVDDHALIRCSLTELFEAEPGIEVLAAVASGEEAIASATQSSPDVVLMDVSMPGMGGGEATREILKVCAQTRVVMLTSFADAEHVLDSIDNGALGYLLKDAESEEFVRGVQAAARGEAPLSPRAARALLAARQERKPATDLTPREREVLALVGSGLANKQIARRLGISEKTVKAHLTNIFQRIGVADRTQAALWAQRNHVV
jgi:DNA-binding NarL/FixJ family response regulator